MFHLFSGIIVYPDISAPRFDRSMIYSSFGDYSEYKTSLVDHIKQSSTTIEYAPTFSEKYNKDTYIDFFKSLYAINSDRPSVYADKQSYATIVAIALKAIFDNIDGPAGYVLYKLSCDQWYIRNIFDTYPRKVFPLLLVDRSIVRQQWKILTQSSFTKLFNTIEITDELRQWFRSINQQLSTEYQIVNHLLGNTAFDDTLKYQIQNAIYGHIVHCLHDLVATTVWNVYRDMSVTTNVITKLKSTESYATITSDIFTNWSKTSSFDNVIPTLQTAIDQLSKANSGIYWDDKEVDSAKLWIDLLSSDTTVDSLISALFDHQYEQFVVYNDYLNNINVLALNYLHDLYYSDSEQAAKYKLSENDQSTDSNADSSSNESV